MAEEFPPFRYVTPADPNIGLRVDGNFILRALLARGGMGAAYLAEHEARAHVKCVVKLVLPELARNPLVISRYRTETEAVSVLKHENIVKLHNFGVLDDGQLFTRFEFVEGKSLDRYVAERGGRLSLCEAAYFIFQICDAMDYAHSCDVIHRDLKPDNLMVEVRPRGSHLTERIKILDFGIAKVESTTERTGSGVQMGTPRFMPPEQVTNAASVTGRADVFAMATIFYLVVTGKLPWGTPESDIAIYHKQKTEAPVRPPEDVMPAAVAAVVLRGLSLVPEDRPTMHEFAIELACAIEARDGSRSGTEVLREVKRDWVTSSLPHAQTLPRPVVVPIVTPVVVERDAPRDGSVPSPNAAPSALVQATASPPSAPDLTVTANARPRAVAASLAGVASATFDAPRAAPSVPDRPPQPLPSVLGANPAAQPSRHRRPPSPVIAAMNTGLVSQRYAVQESPVGTREPSIVAASEIETAVGTPGPQPYAHSQLPAVVVSNTQLSSVTPEPTAPAAWSRSQQEPAPVLVLPEFARRRSRRKLAIGAVLCLAAAIVSFAISRRGSHVATSTRDEGSSTGSARESESSGSGSAREHEAAVSGFVAPIDGSALIVETSPPHTVDAGQLDADATSGSVDSATHPAAVSRVDIASMDRANSAVATLPAPPVYKPAPSGKPATTRVVASRPPSAQKALLRDRQLEARASGAKTGNLHVLATPWAVCWVDGERVAQTPCLLDGLPVGRYRLRLENNIVHKDEMLTATVSAGETTTIERKW